ncbi:hypothetical protein DLAC_11094 [Tieghemostelium lacteum]|uniref:Uncharacterized protein n=1 Tax=Tieghemostelium lacteum TaxID=361077 RepID=A0A151Z358_TIELA|nr:hypothetical protein DLAC_11094 [Tieghemostelium lacteum]|eukprot:KYQ88396.1 hypothetical protein DLAC_11094 [Tieghemostelium lacteum]
MQPSFPNLPPGWQIAVDNMGRYYYFNPITQQQSWTPPAGSSFSNIQQQPQVPSTTPSPSNSLAGSTNNLPININMNQSTTKSSLPEGWEESTDGQGRTYYIDHLNKKTSWIHPSFNITNMTNTTSSTSTAANNNSSNNSNSNNTSSTPIKISYNNLSNNNSTNSSASSSQNDSFYPNMSEFGYSNSLPKNPVVSPSTTTTSTSNSANSGYQRPRNSSLPTQVVKPIPKVVTPVNTTPSTNKKPFSANGSTTLLSQSSPLWDIEKIVPSCSNCYTPFTVIKRRHHCRCCQRELCDPCTLKRIKIPQFNHNDPVRVCEYCFSHQSQNEKTCISRLIPYLFDNYRDPNQQYQALLEIYDYMISYDQQSIERALVGGLKPFLEFVQRIYKESYQTEAVALCFQIMDIAIGNEKLLKTLTEPRDQVQVLIDILAYSSQSPLIQIDCANIIKNLLAMLVKLKNTKPATGANGTGVTSTLSLLSGAKPDANTATTTGAPTITTTIEILPKTTIVQLLSLIESASGGSYGAATQKNKDDLQVHLLGIVSKLMEDEQMKSDLLTQGVISTISPLLLSTHSKVIYKVLKILNNYSQNVENQTTDKMYSAGGFIFLGEMLIKDLDKKTNEIMLKLLLQMSTNMGAKYVNTFIETGIVHNLLIKFTPSANIADYQSAVQVLANLAGTYGTLASFIKSLTNEEIVKALVAGIQNTKSELNCLKIIEGIASNDQCRELLIQCGITEQVIMILCDKSRPPSLPLGILSNLANKSEKVCQSIFEVGGLNMIVEILSTPQPKSTTVTSTSASTTTPSTGGLLSPLSKVPYHNYVNDTEDIVKAENSNSSEDKIKDHLKTQWNCIRLLMRLSSTSKNICKEFVLIENGKGIILLVQLLNPSNSDSVKELVSETLSNLCDDETTAIIVLGEGGLQYTQALLSSNNNNIKSNALKLIQKLATHSPDIKFAISEGTSIQKMVEMLQNQNPELKKSAIYSLSEICRENGSNRDLAYKYGCLNQLISCFNIYTKDIKTLVCVLEILSGFAQEDKYKQELVKSDLIQSIIEYLFNSINIQAKNGEEGFIIQTQIYSVLILSKVITTKDLIKNVLDSGIVLSLTPMLAIKNSYLQEYTLNILTIILPSVTPDFRDIMISNGILQSLSELLTSKNEVILSNCLFILTELAKSQDCGGYLLSTNAITQISDLVIQPSTKENIKSFGIKLISTLFENSSNQTNIWEIFTQKSGIPGLITLLLLGNAVSVSAANAISSIVVDGPGRARVVENGGLQALFEVLKKSPSSMDPLLFVYSLVSVYGLSIEDEICSSIVQLGGLNILLQILSQPTISIPIQNLDYKLYILETLVNLLSNSQCRELVSQNPDFISHIVGILFQDQFKTAGCKILSLVPMNNKSAESIVNYGGTFALINMLHDSTPDANKQLVMTTLLNLVKAVPTSKFDLLCADCSIEQQKESGLTLLLRNLVSETTSFTLKLQILELFEISLESELVKILENTTQNSIDQFIAVLSMIAKHNNNNNSSSTTSTETTTTEPVATVSNETKFSIIFKTLTILSYLSKNSTQVNNQLLTGGFLNDNLLSLLVLPPLKLIDDNDDLLLSGGKGGGVSLLDLEPVKPTVTEKKEVNLSNLVKEEYQDIINKLILEMIFAFSVSDKGKNIIRNMKCIDSIVRFLDTKQQDTLVLALQIIQRLSISSLNRLEIYTNSNAFDRIYEVFERPIAQDASVHQACVDAIYQLLFLDQCHQNFVKRDFYKPLTQCLYSGHETLQYSAIKIINRHLNQSKIVDHLVEKYNIILCFVNIFNNASSENLILYLLRTLNDFLPFDSSRESIQKQVPIDILKTLQSVPNATLRELADNLVSSFSGI